MKDLSPLSRTIVVIVVIVASIWGLYSLTHSHGQPPVQPDTYSCWQGGCSGQ
jgi:hypothetical protein